MNSVLPKQQLVHDLLAANELLLLLSTYEGPHQEIITAAFSDTVIHDIEEQQKSLKSLAYRLERIRLIAEYATHGLPPEYWLALFGTEESYNAYEEIEFHFTLECGSPDLIHLNTDVRRLFDHYEELQESISTILESCVPGLPVGLRRAINTRILSGTSSLMLSGEERQIVALQLALHSINWEKDLKEVKSIVENRGDLRQVLALL